MNKLKAILLAALYVALIPFAAWLVQRFGVQPVGLGLMAPAGVFAIGVILVVRDLLQDELARLGGTARAVGVLAALIVVGTALAYLVDPAFGLASGAAFAVSELLDLAVYTPLRKHGQYGAMVVSNAVGILADSLVFLWIAFGSLEFLYGQMYGKALATMVALGALAVIRERIRSRPKVVLRRNSQGDLYNATWAAEQA